MSHQGTETEFEQTTLERLAALGYERVLGLELERADHREVVCGSET